MRMRFLEGSRSVFKKRRHFENYPSAPEQHAAPAPEQDGGGRRPRRMCVINITYHHYKSNTQVKKVYTFIAKMPNFLLRSPFAHRCEAKEGRTLSIQAIAKRTLNALPLLHWIGSGVRFDRISTVCYILIVSSKKQQRGKRR